MVLARDKKMSKKWSTLTLAKNILPWIIGVGILYYLFKKYSLSQIAESTEHLNVSYFILFTVVYFSYVWLVDTWTLSKIFSRFGLPTKAGELLIPRLASYLVCIVNYGIGQGMFAFFIKQAKKIPFLKSSSLILFVTIIDLYCVITMALVGSFFVADPVPGMNLKWSIQLLWALATLGMLCLLVFSRLPLQWKFIAWIRKSDLFHTIHHARKRDYFLTLCLRLPIHLVVSTSFFIAALPFGIHIPFLRVLASQPVLMLIATIPLTPGGLGTIQLAAIEFFKDHVHGAILDEGIVSPAEMILSITLMTMLGNYLIKGVLGLFVLKKAMAMKHAYEDEVKSI